MLARASSRRHAHPPLIALPLVASSSSSRVTWTLSTVNVGVVDPMHGHPLNPTQHEHFVVPSSTLPPLASPLRPRRPYTVDIPPPSPSLRAPPLPPHLRSAPAHKASQTSCHTRSSASTRRVSNSWQQRHELGRGRPSATKVCTYCSHPFRLPLVRPATL